MRFPLDVVFVGRDSRAILLLERLRPWRFSPLVRGARYVLEAPPGVIASSRTAVGDVIVLER